MSAPRTKWTVVVMEPRTKDLHLDRIETFGPFASKAKADEWITQRHHLAWSHITRIVRLTPP